MSEDGLMPLFFFFSYLIHLYLPGTVSLLQLFVLQHSADAIILKLPPLTEKLWEPVDGHSKDDAHPFSICCDWIPDEIPAKSKCGLLGSQTEHTTLHILFNGHKIIKRLLLRREAVTHIVSVEQLTDTVLEHCRSLHLRHCSAPAVMERK